MPRPKKVDRHALYISGRLAAKLKDIATASVTLVEAPSGFGKTTCICSFMRDYFPENSRIMHICCMDGLPEASWQQVCDAVQAIDAETGSALKCLGAPEGPGAAQAAALLHGINCGGIETWLVIDDFHSMAQIAPDTVWKALACHRDTNLHVVIMAQALGNLSGYALGRQGALYLNGEDLRLEKDELGRYFGKAGMALPPEELDEVYRWTDGWFAAAFLQLNHYIDHKKITRLESVCRLINKVFWAKLGEKEKSLLLCLSLFGGFERQQAAELLALPQDFHCLHTLLNRNDFIRFDTAKGRYNLSGYLTYFLQKEFDLLPEEQSREYLYRAACCCRACGCWTKAFALYYRLRDFEGVLSIPIEGLELAQMDEIDCAQAVKDIIHNAPPELRQKYPLAVLRLMSELFAAGEHEELARLCGIIRREIEHGIYSWDMESRLQGELELAETLLVCNDMTKMGPKLWQAQRLMGVKSTTAHPSVCLWTLGMPSALFAYHSAPGELEREIERMALHLPVYAGVTGGRGQGADALFRAEAHFCRGELEDAAIWAHRAGYQAGGGDQAGVYIATEMLLGRIAIARGDLNGLKDAAGRVGTISDCAPQKPVRMAADMAAAFLAQELGNSDAIPSWLKTGDINRCGLVASAMPFALMLHSKYLLQEGRMEQLIGMADGALALAQRHRHAAVVIYIMIYAAAAHHKLGRHEAAQAIISRAMAMAAPDGLYAPFAENMGLVGLLLPKAGPRDFIEKVTCFAKLITTGRNDICQQLAAVPNPFGLTPREYDVASLAAQGCSNLEISEQLFISCNTVKSYMKTAYQKIGVSSRAELKKAASQFTCTGARHFAMQK